ncbi:armadillo-type protein [Leptodontidium sp. MPI-SDFR-AT-0119]|nr:armadillo-type protein [Leptodontidium sp. MPI-SDFR-AT-0119]
MSNSYMNGGIPADDQHSTPTDPLELVNSRSLVQNPTSDVLGTDSLNLLLTTEQAAAMSKSILDIFELEEEPPKEVEAMGDDEEEEDVDLEDQQRRTERLKGVLSLLAQLWWADSDQIDLVAEKLADGSRDPKWRIPLGDSGVLNFFLEIFSGHILRHTLKIHVLRLIGNSCADTDENRERVVASNYLSSVVLQLQDVTLIAFVIPVLYNICIDYEPAQKQASESFLTRELIDLISSPGFNDSRAFLGYACKLLDLMVAQASDKEHAPESTAIVLLRIAADRELPVDMDDFIAVVNTALAFLQHEKFQKALVAQGALDGALAVLVDSYTRFDSHPSIPTIGSASPSDQDDAKALSQMRSNFNQVLSDVSALPEFQEAYPVTSPFSSSLRRWLSSPQLQLKVCACIMLGNLARSDATCEEFVHVSQVHKLLINILVDAIDSQLLHAAIGFLKNLALPVKNKEVLGDAGLFEVLPRLWAMDILQPIQFSAISLARQLTIGNFNNVRRVCKRLSEDQDSPSYNRTKLSLLIALFERTDVEPVKMEIARLVTSICRVFNTGAGRSADEAETKRIQKVFFTRHPDVGRPLSFMVSQTKWPVVRSEGWFVFALMARTEEGSQCISDMLQDVVVFRPLVEMLTGKALVDYTPSSSSPSSAMSPHSTSPAGSSPPIPAINYEAQTPESPQPHAQAAEMARLDRENATVMISELLKNRGGQMAVMRRTLLEDLLRGGTELVMSYREAMPNWRAPNTGPSAPDKRHRAGLNLQEVTEQSFREFS